MTGPKNINQKFHFRYNGFFGVTPPPVLTQAKLKPIGPEKAEGKRKAKRKAKEARETIIKSTFQDAAVLAVCVKDNIAYQNEACIDLFIQTIECYQKVYIVIGDKIHGKGWEILAQNWMQNNKLAIEKAKEMAQKLNKHLEILNWEQFNARFKDDFAKIPENKLSFQAYEQTVKVVAFEFHVKKSEKKKYDHPLYHFKLQLLDYRINKHNKAALCNVIYKVSKIRCTPQTLDLLLEELKHRKFSSKKDLQHSVDFLSEEGYKFVVGVKELNANFIHAGEVSKEVFNTAAKYFLPKDKSIINVNAQQITPEKRSLSLDGKKRSLLFVTGASNRNVESLKLRTTNSTTFVEMVNQVERQQEAINELKKSANKFYNQKSPVYACKSSIFCETDILEGDATDNMDSKNIGKASQIQTEPERFCAEPQFKNAC